LVVVLLHHHLYWWACIPLAISLMISMAIRFVKGGPWLLFVASSYWWACVNHRNILLRTAAFSISKHSRRPFLMQVS
jgi:hypothetical protein